MFGRDRDADADLETAREQMVERLRHRVDDEDVLDAMRAVPRHAFIPESKHGAAYEDRPLPIGADQTISAPHMVAIMAAELDLDAGEDVLEIGTGCGYHAAVTAELVGAEHVHSVEYHDSLAAEARETLADLGYGDVSVRQGDGHAGWPEHAPYDAAYLTCASPEFPGAVVEQIRDGGRLLGPIGDRRQELVFARKTGDGLRRERHGGVRFVPMRGGE